MSYELYLTFVLHLNHSIFVIDKHKIYSFISLTLLIFTKRTNSNHDIQWCT